MNSTFYEFINIRMLSLLKFRTPEMAQIRLKHRLERLNSAENLH
jgi:hypothetical protein